MEKNVLGSTNYINTFIEVAEDCPVKKAIIPPYKAEKKSIANLQFELISENPYKYTSDEVLFTVFCVRNEIPENRVEKERNLFFSKGQPCFRSSPLTKRYGWGVHSNAEGKIALYAVETNDYYRFLDNNSCIKKKAMRNKRS